MKTKARLGWFVILLFVAHVKPALSAEPNLRPTNTVRIAAAQAARRVVDFRLKPAEALAAVEKNLGELEQIVDRAGEAKCDALVLPEDTPGLLNWVGANEALAKEVLPKAVQRMFERLGSAAARHKMYLVVCSDFTESDGGTYNTAFLLGRDGKEMGRYHKVCPTWPGSRRAPARKFVPGFSHARSGHSRDAHLLRSSGARDGALPRAGGRGHHFFPDDGRRGHRRR